MVQAEIHFGLDPKSFELPLGFLGGVAQARELSRRIIRHAESESPCVKLKWPTQLKHATHRSSDSCRIPRLRSACCTGLHTQHR